jgi:spore maturation protein A
MIVSGITWLVFYNPTGILPIMLSASSSGVSLAISLCAIYIVWMGIIQIAIDAGLIDKLAKALKPLIKFLFGEQSPEVNSLIATNISANMIGAGAAATPAAILAMEKMSKPGQTKASKDMLMLFILSATSLQVIPTTVIGILESHGAVNAAGIILPTLLVSFISTVIGVICVKI